jgi:Cof subfamily protein (haloacid dehalogenase superfamily)
LFLQRRDFCYSNRQKQFDLKERQLMGSIVFIDVDGTLVTYENVLPESAVSAIRKARANGHRVYITTGRSRAEVYQNIWDIGLDGMIGGNGSYVEDHGQVILHQLITRDQCRRIVDWLHERGLEFYLESNNGLFASENFETAGLTAIREYSKRKGRASSTLTIREAFPDMIFGGELYRDDLNKVSYLLNTYQDFLDTRDHFPDLENNTWGGAGETALFGDLGVKNITKAHALQVLLDHLGASVQDTIALGDAKIDIPMLQLCRWGVAMGNAGEETKAAADYITDDVENDGLWKAFEHFGLI